MKIKKGEDYKKCPKCHGTGKVVQDEGHDCWGRAEWSYQICPVCHGKCYLISLEASQRILKKLGLDNR